MHPNDHRALGARLDLFHFQEEAPGMPFWHPRGWTLYRLVEAQIRKRLEEDGYQEIKTPPMLSEALWRQSGHWEMFRANMFRVDAADAPPPGPEARPLALKPVSCPAHVQVFKSRVRSWRDLPLRLAEFGCCCRNEPSGAHHGLMRAVAFVQDDAHIFCRAEDLAAEVGRFVRLLKRIWADFGLDAEAISPVGFSTRPLIRAGNDALWDRAEAALEDAARAAGLDLVVQPGEGAFYGPKLEFFLKDAAGRSWQCGTVQADFVLPGRLGAEYAGQDGKAAAPVMLHRAALGSLERFIGVLLERNRGRLPLWLSPDQIVVTPIGEDQAARAAEVHAAFRAAGLRASLDLGNGTLAKKARDAAILRVPVFVVIGKREAEDGSVALRRGNGVGESLPFSQAIERLAAEAHAP